MKLKALIVCLFCLLILVVTTKTEKDVKNKKKAEVNDDEIVLNTTNATDTDQNITITHDPSVSFNFLDAPLADISWCGTDKETIFILTEAGSLYKTTNFAQSWTKLNDNFAKAGLKHVDTKDEIGKLARMLPSPVDKSLYIFLGTEGLNWITTDCGKKIKAINQVKPIHEFDFHPTEKNWVLASSWTQCDDKSKENCRTYKELLFSDDLGENWKVLAKYIVQYQWAWIDASFNGIVPKERIIISHDKKAKGNQILSGWSENVQLSMSDDFFKTSTEIVPKVQVSDEAEQDVALLVSDPRVSKYEFKQISLPNQRIREHSYTILDTSEKQIFLHINHEGSKSTYGNIYISDSTGTRFSFSLAANVRNYDGQCDFEKVQGLEGIYLANVYDKDQLKRVKSGQDDENTIPQESKSGKKSTPGPFSRAAPFDDSFNKLVDYKQSVITFNKGGIWSPVTAPIKDSNDKKIICSDIEACSLHLHSISNNRFGPFYSTENSLGIILGTGNVGSYLSNREDEINTYLSRDGGLTWFEVKKGSHIYEIGDHGSILVLAQDQVASKEVYYSWNEGLNWNILEINDEPVEIMNIITEPSNTAEKFLVYGRTKGTNPKGMVVGIDFTPVHQRWCQLQDKPGTEGSDYELWTPNGKTSPNCLMGHKTTYIRRKREAKCFNSEEWEKWFFFDICQCTEEDWECDIGFSRQGNGPCLPDNEVEVNYDPPEKCDGWYYVSQGYRKIAGNTCQGGVNHEALKLPCSGLSVLNKNNMIILFALIFMIVLLLLLTNSNLSNKWKNYKDKMFGAAKQPKARKDFAPLKNWQKNDKDDEDFDIFHDNEIDADAEAIEVKNLVELGKNKKKMTSGNALEMAKKSVPTLQKPNDNEMSLKEFDPRG